MRVIGRDNVIYGCARTDHWRVVEHVSSRCLYRYCFIFFSANTVISAPTTNTNCNRFCRLRGRALECLESGKMFKHCNMFHSYTIVFSGCRVWCIIYYIYYIIRTRWVVGWHLTDNYQTDVNSFNWKLMRFVGGGA